MTKKERFAAVIDIGSNELRLKIAENVKNSFKYVDSLTYPLSLGRDTFNNGKISFEKVGKACEIITNFLSCAAGYGVRNIQVIATTAVREAVNTDYILDQIMIKTGMKIRVMDDMEEKLYIFKMMMRQLAGEMKQSAMMVYIGSGNIGASVLEEGRMPFLQNIKVGTLRISELFETMQDYSGEFYLVLEEYLSSFTDMLEGDIPDRIRNFIVSGNEIAMVAELTQAEKDGIFYIIPIEKFLSFYDTVKRMTADRISREFGIPFEKAEVLLPAMCIYDNLLSFTQAERIISPQVMLCDAILYEMLFPAEFGEINKEFNKNTLLSSRAHARKFGAAESHSRLVEKFAVLIFDKMKKVHGLGAREKLLLQTAAILHEVGKHINLRNHSRHSYNIVSGLDIVGLNQLETEIVATICLYHSRHTPTLNDENYAQLSVSDRVLASKLTAIFRVADSLDRSHIQKFGDLDVKLTDEGLSITVSTGKNSDLENWSFDEKSRFFEEVFGIKAALRKKKKVS